MGKKKKKDTPVFKNKKVYHEYEVLDKFEAGLALKGTEVKSLREGNASIKEGYCRLIKGEVYLVGAHIAPYTEGNQFNHDPFRNRKLLLHKHEIQKIEKQVEQKGLTLVPIRLYFKRGYAKLLIGLGRGKKLHDKRQDLKRKDAKRRIEREIRKYT